jgi:hypothetical protein
MPSEPSLENKTNFIPQNNIVKVSRSPVLIDSSFFSPADTDAEGNIINSHSEIVLNKEDVKEMADASMEGLYEYHVGVSGRTHQKILQLIREFTQENEHSPRYVLSEIVDFQGKEGYRFFFEDDFVDWVSNKEQQSPGYVSFSLANKDDPFLAIMLKQLISEKRDGSMVGEVWAPIGEYSAADMKELAGNFKEVVQLLFEREDSQNMQSRTELHEKMHYIQMDALFYGAQKDLLLTYLQPLMLGMQTLLSKVRRENSEMLLVITDPQEERRRIEQMAIPHEKLRDCLFHLKSLMYIVLGLDEAHSILHEIYNTPVLKNGEVAAADAYFSTRLAVLLSHLKRRASDKESVFGLELNSFSTNPAHAMLEPHDLGTLILLTNGEIMRPESEFLIEMEIQGKALTEETIVKLLHEYIDDVQGFFTQFRPETMKQRIEAHLYQALMRIVHSIEEIFSLLTLDDKVIQPHSATKYELFEKFDPVQLTPIKEKLQKSAPMLHYSI